jgi:hypothetical protein
MVYKEGVYEGLVLKSEGYLPSFFRFLENKKLGETLFQLVSEAKP